MTALDVESIADYEAQFYSCANSKELTVSWIWLQLKDGVFQGTLQYYKDGIITQFTHTYHNLNISSFQQDSKLHCLNGPVFVLEFPIRQDV